MKKWFGKKIFAVALCTVIGVQTFGGMGFPKNESVSAVATSLIAFPGAKGGGSLATGGRGGTVVHVTNLNDSGAGSFREAVGTSNRIVVFDVGGTIELKSDVVVKGNVTVAGQTAPGGSGITLKNYKLGLGGDNIVVRYISSRPGERGTNADYDAWGGSNGGNSIVDHCSLGWANDEQWGLYSACDNLTVQYSVIGPSNSFSYHSKGVHGFGIMFGRTNVTWDHNLIVHNVSRNFRGKVPGTGVADFTNNVIYNWGYQTAYGTIGHVNYVGNTLKKGVSTQGGHNYVSVGDSGTAPENYLIYLTGNRFINIDNSQYSNFSDNNWAGMKYGDSKNETNTRTNTAFAMNVNGVNVSSVNTVESSENAYNNVINFAGNGISTDLRTAIDKQVAYETKTGTGQLTGARPYAEATDAQKATIDKYKIQCGVKYEYPGAVLKKTIVDTDNDGMPDDWESARGLDSNKNDANGDYCGKGYNNIEYYINDLTANSFPEGVVELSPIISVAPLEGTLIKSLNINDTGNRANWSIQNNLQTGDLIYGDRTNTYTTVPNLLKGAEWIKLACDSKNYTSDVAEFTVGKAISVFVGLDSRVTELPAWMSDWIDTGETISASNDVLYKLYKKDYSEGSKVILGSNGVSSGVVMYTAFVIEVGSKPVEIDYIKGDINNDQNVNVTDLALMKQGIIYGFKDNSSKNAADVTGDGIVNSADVKNLKKYIFMKIID